MLNDVDAIRRSVAIADSAQAIEKSRAAVSELRRRRRADRSASCAMTDMAGKMLISKRPVVLK